MFFFRRYILQSASRGLTVPLQTRLASSGPRIARAALAAESDSATTTVVDKDHDFIVDEPTALGGNGTGPSPLAHFLGALIGCTQITLHTIAQEKQIKMGKVRWKATGKFDLRGLRGEEGISARFKEIHMLGEVDTYHPEKRLVELVEEIKQRCIISATIGSSQHTRLTTELRAAPKVFKSSMGCWIDAAMGHDFGKH